MDLQERSHKTIFIMGGSDIYKYFYPQCNILHITEVVQYALTCLWQSLNRSKSWRFLRDWLQHHRQDHPRGQLGYLVTLLLLLIIFIAMCFSVSHDSALQQINQATYHFFRSIRSLNSDNVMIVLSGFGYKYVLLTSGMITAGYLAYRRHWRSAFHLAAVLVFGAASILMIKHIVFFSAKRPENIPVIKETLSKYRDIPSVSKIVVSEN